LGLWPNVDIDMGFPVCYPPQLYICKNSEIEITYINFLISKGKKIIHNQI